MSSDATCDLCGSEPNYVWMAPHDLWEEIVGDKKAFWCIPCFTSQAFRQGIKFCWQPIIREPHDRQQGLSL